MRAVKPHRKPIKHGSCGSRWAGSCNTITTSFLSLLSLHVQQPLQCIPVSNALSSFIRAQVPTFGTLLNLHASCDMFQYIPAGSHLTKGWTLQHHNYTSYACMFSLPRVFVCNLCLCVQVATEGDAFTMAFHDPVDAIAWALNVQHRLLLLPWPEELLQHPECTKLTAPPGGAGPAIFCGLRVRMAIHTGQPDSIQVPCVLCISV